MLAKFNFTLIKAVIKSTCPLCFTNSLDTQNLLLFDPLILRVNSYLIFNAQVSLIEEDDLLLKLIVGHKGHQLLLKKI